MPTTQCEPLAELLSESAERFTSQYDFDLLLRDIAKQARRVLPAERVIVYSNVDDRLAAAAGSPALRPDAAPSEAARQCVSRLQPVLTDPAADASRRASLSVPLMASQNRVLAAIEWAAGADAEPFTEADAQTTQAFARIAAIAVDRARLFFRIDEWRKSVESLILFNATVNQPLEPRRMVRELVTNVAGFLEAQGGMSGLAVETDAGVELQCDGFFYQGEWRDFRRAWAEGQGIPGTVRETQFPYLNADYTADPLHEHQLAERFDLGPCVCVPIKNRREEVLGFFQLNRRSGAAAFTWQDAAFLESLGNTAAVAIENAMLVESLELKTQQVKNLSQDSVRRLEDERRHIARELHDGIGQILVGLNLRLQLLSGLLTPDQESARGELDDLRRHVSGAAVELRDMAKRLRPPTLDELGFESTVRGLVAEFRAHAAFSITLQFGSKPELSNDEETTLYRVTQECLTNIVKHAEASRVEVWFGRTNGQQILRITDDGVGFSPHQVSEGLGHIGISERVTMLGGRVEIDSAPGQGTSIAVTFYDGDPA